MISNLHYLLRHYCFIELFYQINYVSRVLLQISFVSLYLTPISPLIFISLIENAFKHGISGNNLSFINISLSELPEGKVKFVSRNSYFPKTKSDKSGSGIGLELVRKRLDLLYPNRYTWNANIEDNIYTTELIIDTNNNQYEAQLLDN